MTEQKALLNIRFSFLPTSFISRIWDSQALTASATLQCLQTSLKRQTFLAVSRMIILLRARLPCSCCSVAKAYPTFVTSWMAAGQASLSFTISRSLLKFMSTELVMLSNMSSSAAPFSFCLQSFPASGYFPMSRLFASGGQITRVSASVSVLPMNIHD